MFRSAIFGAFIGVQLGPLLAFTEGKMGERLRAAGWESWRLSKVQAGRAQLGWACVRRVRAERGVTQWLQRMKVRVREWDNTSGTSRRCIALMRDACSVLRLAWSRFLSSRVARQLRSLWERTTIPRRFQDFKQRVILQARMADIRRSEFR